MKKTKLLSCPFCNGAPVRQGHTYNGDKVISVGPLNIVRYEQKHWYIVKCPQCGISQPRKRYSTREESDAAWNNRTKEEYHDGE